MVVDVENPYGAVLIVMPMKKSGVKKVGGKFSEKEKMLLASTAMQPDPAGLFVSMTSKGNPSAGQIPGEQKPSFPVTGYTPVCAAFGEIVKLLNWILVFA